MNMTEDEEDEGIEEHENEDEDEEGDDEEDKKAQGDDEEVPAVFVARDMAKVQFREVF